MTQPVWLFDVDGVIADFCDGVDRVAESIGVERSDWRHWKLEDNYPEHQQSILAAVRNIGFARGLKEVPGAVEAIRDVIRSGAVRVVFVTAPMPGSDTWAADRMAWLYERFDSPEIIFAVRKDLIRGDVFVDDNPDNATKWWDAHKTGKAYMPRRPYNKTWHLSNFAVGGVEEAIRKAVQ